MPNRSTDTLFQLIQSLETAEKRHFKLYMKSSSGGSGDLKVVQLFDALDKMKHYDEETLLKNIPVYKNNSCRTQSPLVPGSTYKPALTKKEENIDLQLHEQLDFARLLYNKGLYLQSLKVLDKIKDLARNHHQVTYILQVVFLEKKLRHFILPEACRTGPRS